jgi:hypothetical protein
MSPLESLVQRIRGEYQEMLGLCLTFAQACRLWHMDATACQGVLDILIGEKFLTRSKDGSFIALHANTSRPVPIKADLRPFVSASVLRRAA